MEVLVILILLIIAALILSIRSKLFDRMDRLEEHYSQILKVLIKQEERADKEKAAPVSMRSTPGMQGPEPEVTSIPKETEPYAPYRRPAQPNQPARQEPPTQPVPPASTGTPPPKPENIPSPASMTHPQGQPSSASAIPSSIPPPPAVPQHNPSGAGKLPTETHQPDLEKFIGENLISKIGIGILVLGIAFFVKYAIDNDWIGPVGRVGIGLLCGGILVGLAHALRKNYKAFSSILVGGGLAVFYFTIALAYHQYHLFNQTASFIIMVVITLFAVLLSLLYDRQELAIIALTGGFITPMLVSNGSNNYIVLFTYLLILNTGLLIIAYNKAWRWLNLLAFVFTTLLFGSWLFMLPYDTHASTYQGGFIYATIFYILFFIINLAHNIKENKRFLAWDFGILLAGTALYFIAGLYILSETGQDQYRGLFSAAMGVFNLAVSWILLRNKKVDSNILYLLIGITVSCVSLTAPLQLHGHFITLFWASESVVLCWLYERSGIRIIQRASLLIWGATLFSLLMDWASVYNNIAFFPNTDTLTDSLLPILFNKGFITGLFAAGSNVALYYLHRKMERSALSSGLFALTATLILFITGLLEVNYQFRLRLSGSEIYSIYQQLYIFIFIYVLSWIAADKKWMGSYLVLTILLSGAALLYLLLIPEDFSIQEQLLTAAATHTSPSSLHFMAHWLCAATIGAVIYRLITWQQQNKTIIPGTIFTWLIGLFIVIFLSVETHLLANSIFYSQHTSLALIESIYYKAGLSILWGLCSFVFMWQGMRSKYKPLRIISLVLFAITILKLFCYDIRDIGAGGKIAAFICLGVLLLVVSFMYQRLKKILIEDEDKQK